MPWSVPDASSPLLLLSPSLPLLHVGSLPWDDVLPKLILRRASHRQELFNNCSNMGCAMGSILCGNHITNTLLLLLQNIDQCISPGTFCPDHPLCPHFLPLCISSQHCPAPHNTTRPRSPKSSPQTPSNTAPCHAPGSSPLPACREEPCPASSPNFFFFFFKSLLPLKGKMVLEV